MKVQEQGSDLVRTLLCFFILTRFLYANRRPLRSKTLCLTREDPAGQRRRERRGGLWRGRGRWGRWRVGRRRGGALARDLFGRRRRGSGGSAALFLRRGIRVGGSGRFGHRRGAGGSRGLLAGRFAFRFRLLRRRGGGGGPPAIFPRAPVFARTLGGNL